MNKNLVNSITDKEFIKIVNNSKSINEVAKKLGFQYTPGGGSKKRIKDRMNQLNLSFEEKEYKKDLNYEKKNSNYNSTTDIGNIGEAKFILDCTRNNISLYKPVFDGDINDFIIKTKDGFKKIQVKTSEFIEPNNEVIRFTISKGVSYNKGRRIKASYKKEDVDYFYLYCIENDESYLVNNYFSKKEIKIRLNETNANNQYEINYRKDYLFDNVIKDIL
jgi:hypothetical protein